MTQLGQKKGAWRCFDDDDENHDDHQNYDDDDDETEKLEGFICVCERNMCS